MRTKKNTKASDKKIATKSVKKRSLSKKSVVNLQFDREQIRNWVYKRLGEPVVLVEIEKGQFDTIFNSIVNSTMVSLMIREEVLASCAETLSLIRGKVKKIPVPGGESIETNYKELEDFSNKVRRRK